MKPIELNFCHVFVETMFEMRFIFTEMKTNRIVILGPHTIQIKTPNVHAFTQSYSLCLFWYKKSVPTSLRMSKVACNSKVWPNFSCRYCMNLWYIISERGFNMATCHTSNEPLAIIHGVFEGKLISRWGDITWVSSQDLMFSLSAKT